MDSEFSDGVERSASEERVVGDDPFAVVSADGVRMDRLAKIQLDEPANVVPCNTIGDNDCDGVFFPDDCDDQDATIGAVIYDNDFTSDNGWFQTPPTSGGAPWVYNQGALDATDGGPQAVIGQPRSWTNIVVYAIVAMHDTSEACWGNGGVTNQWRAGVTVRASTDSDQNEGFHGYRCALGSDTDGTGINPGSGPSSGQFLQVAEYMDAPEPDMSANCEENSANSFNELTRTNHSALDITDGYAAFLKLYAMNDIISCHMVTTSTIVSAQAQDDSFASGTVGLSTLNALGRFDHLRVCAINTP